MENVDAAVGSVNINLERMAAETGIAGATVAEAMTGDGAKC